MRVPLNFEEARHAARSRLPRGLFEYIDRGAEDEVALRLLRSTLDSMRLMPRSLRDVSSVGLSVKLFGQHQPSPMIVAPTAAAGLVWHEGEVALAQAAARAGIPFCVSMQSVTPIEKIARDGGARLWFQLYVWRNRERMAQLVARAERAGAEALVLTVDTAVTPNREYNQRNGFGIPLRLSWRGVSDVVGHPRWMLSVFLRSILSGGIPTYAHYPPEFRTSLGRVSLSNEIALAQDVTLEDIHRLRDIWPRKFILKGILSVEDAVQAAETGIDGIVVSNHGARNLDCAPHPVEVLPSIAEAVGHRLTILADSGIRRGADIARYMALGAQAVMVGRAPLYGLAAGGATSAYQVIELLSEELRTTLGMLGKSDLFELGKADVFKVDKKGPGLS